MNLVSKRKRKKEKATYHECDLCKGLHYKVRRGHGYLLDRLRQANDPDWAMKASEFTKKYPHPDRMPAWYRAYSELVDFERHMRARSARYIERDQRRREGMWW